MVKWVRRLAALPKRRRAAGRPRDFQRSRLYGWEGVHVLPRDPTPLSLLACRELVATVFADRLGAGVPAPRVEDGRGRRHAAGSREVIKLPRWARTRPIVLHECAHGLAADGHGPDFARVYIDLLADFMAIDRSEMERTAGRAGLKVTSAGHAIQAPKELASPGVAAFHGRTGARRALAELRCNLRCPGR